MQKMRQGDWFQSSFFVFKKALIKIKASGQHLGFNMFWKTSTWIYNKNKFIAFLTVGPEIHFILSF